MLSAHERLLCATSGPLLVKATDAANVTTSVQNTKAALVGSAE